jgi:hypothetical protein
VCRAARSDGTVGCTHAATQDNAVAGVRMLHLQVSSPIFHSDSITHSVTMHEVRHEISVPRRQADPELCAGGCIVCRTWCTVMLQAEHCTPVRKRDKQRETSDNV